MGAGDALYVPAYAIHRVVGVSWAVSLSMGLRVYNEIDVVEHLLGLIRQSSYMRYPPLPAFPETMDVEHAAAKSEMLRRVRALLAEVEGVALASLLQPTQLPDHSGVATS